MNPHDELQSLIELFPDREPLLADAEHVPSETLPEPYRRMLAHNHHMTVTMESYYGCPVDVRILDRRLDGDFYNRKIVLLKSGTETVVQFGIVRFDLSYVTPTVREEILAGQKPLGRVLIDHNVLRHIDLGAVLRLTAGPSLARVSANAGRRDHLRPPGHDLLQSSRRRRPVGDPGSASALKATVRTERG